MIYATAATETDGRSDGGTEELQRRFSTLSLFLSVCGGCGGCGGKFI